MALTSLRSLHPTDRFTGRASWAGWAQSGPPVPTRRVSAGQRFSCLALRHLDDYLTCGSAVRKIRTPPYHPRSASRRPGVIRSYRCLKIPHVLGIWAHSGAAAKAPTPPTALSSTSSQTKPTSSTPISAASGTSARRWGVQPAAPMGNGVQGAPISIASSRSMGWPAEPSQRCRDRGSSS